MITFLLIIIFALIIELIFKPRFDVYQDITESINEEQLMEHCNLWFNDITKTKKRKFIKLY